MTRAVRGPARATPAQVLAALQAAAALVLVGHEEPDGDCIASQLVLGEFLAGRGKRVGLYSAGPFDRHEIRHFAARFRPVIEPEMLRRHPTAVLLDCATPERTGSLARQLHGLPAVVIDHHVEGPAGEAGVPYGDLRLVDPAAPATAYLVQLIVEAANAELSAAHVDLLLFGLCTDTGFFRHVAAGSTAAFQAAARLVAGGADPRAIYQRIYGGRSFAQRRLLGTLLQRTEQHAGGGVLFTWQSLRDLQQLGAAPASHDELYDLLRTVADSDVVAFVREKPDGDCSVSLRSSPALDVAVVAQQFGGGGHRQAAGFTWPGTVAALRAALLPRLAAATAASRTAQTEPDPAT